MLDRSMFQDAVFWGFSDEGFLGCRDRDIGRRREIFTL
jgi:hypothetical protein